MSRREQSESQGSRSDAAKRGADRSHSGESSLREASAPAIVVEHLTVSYGPVPALLDINFSISPGQLIGVIGPNGSGKSTLIKTLLGFLEPDFGTVRLFGQTLEQARGRIAYVPQRGAVDWDFPITVNEVVLMGRYGHVPWYRNLSAEDRRIASEALELVRMSDFAHRQIGQLSGGQQQRVFMARAMAQGGDILLLDEPFAGVDAATERAILDVLVQTKERGKTLVVVHHDLSTAARYFDALLLIKQRLFAYGPPDRVLDPDLLAQVYEGRLLAIGPGDAKSQRDQAVSPQNSAAPSVAMKSEIHESRGTQEMPSDAAAEEAS